ncbi:MAG: YD repeat-containing protein [Chloroflexi bacterium OLB13]|nr:MAG: YD repeat-containing protein [Chloroflexi bacterium OLB13]
MSDDSTMRAVFDGTLQSAAEYDPFGGPIVSPIGTAYGFTGELTDDNGLVYLRARYLAPSLGTFASRDPWRGSASAPRTWNGYAWVEGNVVNRVDPGGMQSSTPRRRPLYRVRKHRSLRLCLRHLRRHPRRTRR